MLDAFILVQTNPGKAADAHAQISGIRGVKRASVTTGPYDLVLEVSAETIESLADPVLREIQGVSGVTRTLTCPVVRI